MPCNAILKRRQPPLACGKRHLLMIQQINTQFARNHGIEQP
jgi:hypothetical protein